MAVSAPVVLLLVLVLLVEHVGGWVRWDYATEWAAGLEVTKDKIRSNQETYFTTWGYNVTPQASPRNREKNAKTTCDNSGFCKTELGANWVADQNAPRPRRGHSMVILETPSSHKDYQGYTYVVMFGGRDNDNTSFVHIPKTYKVETVNGTIRFATYEDMPVDPCNDHQYKWYTKAQVDAANCNDGVSHDKITVGIIYNDVWAYKMCMRVNEPPSTPGFAAHNSNPGTKVPTMQPTGLGAIPSKRYFDSPCVGSGWVMLHSGAPEGGCVIQLGILVCTVPSERYNHGSVIFNDGTMYVYGGFSQRCADYCDDLWFFDIFMKSWRQVYCSSGCGGDLSHLYTDTLSSYTGGRLYPYGKDPETGLDQVPLTPNRSTKAIPNPWAGPGKRWRFTWVYSTDIYPCQIPQPPSIDGSKPATPFKKLSDAACDPAIHAQCCQDSALFGGHRLWQGYDKGNSQENDWESYKYRQKGGYLDDLWFYTKFLDYKTVAGSTFKKSDGIWKYVWPVNQTFANFDINNWAYRDRYETFTIWPPARAGAGLAYDTERNLLWLHGGYCTYFPYLSTDGEGSADGPGSIGIGGFVPYPGYDYFRSDLWFYNMTSRLWQQIEFQPDDAVPEGRTDHVFLIVGEILFLHGGFGDNYYYDDTWYFNITTFKWLKKERLVYPIYPPSCTDDIDYIFKNKSSNCEKNAWPSHLERQGFVPFDIIPYSPGGQKYYWPDLIYGPYFKPFDKGVDHSAINFRDGSFEKKFPKALPKVGEAEWPHSALGPMEYAREFHIKFNDTFTATLFERCTSVFGEPTRIYWQPDPVTGQVRDTSFNKSASSILIPQPRRQAPGWDGCRDRWDGRKDLPMVLQYQRPSARAGHKAVFYKSMNEIIMYGGTAYAQETPKSVVSSAATEVMDDMWYFNLFHCVNNCSNHGICYFGFCQCYVGYYGEDCGNVSCPGTACYYDDYTHDQTCVHACQAGYLHGPNDSYVQDIAKVPCNPEPAHLVVGESNGICDGFGTVQCAPPFLGDDCGTRDCQNNCSFNGWCSIEYPVSRCMCQPGYFGEFCEHKLCLNNCSYPNGVCNTTTGYCNCRPTYSPYNNTRPYHQWDGEDCSWLWAYAAGRSGRAGPDNLALALLLVLGVGSMLSGGAGSTETRDAASDQAHLEDDDEGEDGGRDEAEGEDGEELGTICPNFVDLCRP